MLLFDLRNPYHREGSVGKNDATIAAFFALASLIFCSSLVMVQPFFFDRRP